MTPDNIESFLSLAIGFAVAGVLTSAYQALASRPLGFSVMVQREKRTALMSVPLLVFAAPFIIMRYSLRTARTEPGHAAFVALATALAGFWSLMSGTVVAAGWVGLVQLLG
jgi:hypothetical protein